MRGLLPADLLAKCLCVSPSVPERPRTKGVLRREGGLEALSLRAPPHVVKPQTCLQYCGTGAWRGTKQGLHTVLTLSDELSDFRGEFNLNTGMCLSFLSIKLCSEVEIRG